MILRGLGLYLMINLRDPTFMMMVLKDLSFDDDSEMSESSYFCPAEYNSNEKGPIAGLGVGGQCPRQQGRVHDCQDNRNSGDIHRAGGIS
ncbi:hypothetical protein ElyMa_006787200 [Elysia marginata]|uniref:Uncharacterized protein n=1 Tax=Elysia marginata TaxID=1093978 RepID=A0AAV4J697_9GAST|nr:hypothetical protein ElyMa_006787200 [Elysia marginata]